MSSEGNGDSRWSAQVNALGGFIRAQRQLANLSLREMAAMTSVSNAYLSQVERGLHQPSLKVLHSIADALQLSTEQLLSQAGWTRGYAESPRPTATRRWARRARSRTRSAPTPGCRPSSARRCWASTGASSTDESRLTPAVIDILNASAHYG